MTVFLCGETPDDIFCGIYDAWMSRLGHKNVRLEPFGWTQDLFCQYKETERQAWKGKKAADSIRTKLSEPLYELVYKAALSQDPLRADKIYRFLIYAFSVGPAVTDMLHLPEVFDIIQMERNLDRELQHLKGFTRFSQMSGNILLGKINPKNDILELLSLHFADRLSGEHWILYDEKRQKAAVHHADGRWVVVSTRSKAWMEFLSEETDEPVYENLWKTFHQSIAIPERTNRACQTQMLPLRFRPYMTEFQ